MITYDNNKKYAYFDGHTFTRDENTNYFLSAKPTKKGIRQRLHVYVWEFYNGDIPEGYEIHHIDMDKFSNEIENLEMLTNKEHMRIHADEFLKDEKRKKESTKILIEKAQPEAIKWHKSKAGREWHKEHYERVKDKFHVIEQYTCDNCGKGFETLKGNNRFCCNNCKSAWRRKQGIDNEERECVICGEIFTVNKYSKTKTCSVKCRGRLRSLNSQK